jgi:hypothetical protein
MAFTPIENQPIIFNPVTPCYVEETDFTYPMDLTDTSQIAFALTPCDDAVANEQNTITPSETGWEIDDQIYTSTGVSGATLTITNDASWNTQTLWQFKISIESYTAGVLIIQIPGWGDYTIMGNGVYTFYVSSASSLATWTIISNPFIGTILLENGLNQNPIILPVNVNNLVHIINTETDAIIDTLTPTIYNNIAVYTANWNEYPAACYKLAYIDGCENFAGRFTGICNGVPTDDLTCWTNNGSGSWTFDDAFFFEQEAGSGQGRLSNGTLLQAGFTYQITFELVSMTSATTYRMTWLSEAEVTTQIGPLLSTGDIGVHTFSYTPIVDGYLQLQFSASSPSSEGKIKDVIVELTGPFDYDGETPCMCTGADTTCSLELGGCFSDTFIMAGVELDNRFQPTLRLSKNPAGSPIASLIKKQYLIDMTKYRSSTGKNQLNYFDVQNTYILRIEQQPEFIFDFLFKMWIAFDNMLINGQAFRFNPDQAPIIEWQDKTALGSVDIEVLPFQEKTRKVLCGFRNQPCQPITPTNEVGMLYEDLDGMLYQNELGRLYNKS